MRPVHRLALGATALLLAAGTGVALTPATASPPAARAVSAAKAGPGLPGGYHHLVVIYEENHSFDNLYGQWGRVGSDLVEGLDQATAGVRQVGQDGARYHCLPQDDVNLTSPPLSDECSDPGHGIAASHFHNRPFAIDRYIGPDDRTCPAPGVSAPNGVPKDSEGAQPGGCTRDLVHRFYQDQYQEHGGLQDRYTTGSDALGLTQGYYRTKDLPIYKYLHSAGAPKYTIADHFFQGAFGGSFLNHQWLIAARAPVDTSHGAGGAKYSVLDDNGMPTSYPQYHATRTDVVDGQLTQKCPGTDMDDPDRACGSYAVNTVQPGQAPRNPTGAFIPLINDDDYPNIGDRMTAAGISWKWYSGGWNDANRGHPGPLFQYHHQPFNYFAAYAPGTPGRKHLRDERDFYSALRGGRLPTVSFVKPYGAENEHPGYASEPDGSDHLVDLIERIRSSEQGADTLIVVTYDEFGGQWDHVPAPVVDAFGPGTRIPALVIGGHQTRSGVDHTTYDTTSIIATIEHSFGLAPIATRDQVVNDLGNAVASGE